MPHYVVLQNKNLIINSAHPIEHIAREIAHKGKDYHSKYKSVQELDAQLLDFKSKGYPIDNYLIVVLNEDPKNFKELSVQEQEAKIKESIAGVVLNQLIVRKEYLENPKKEEERHLTEVYEILQQNSLNAKNEDLYFLTQSPLHDIDQLEPDLRYLLFADFVLLLLKRESWLSFNQRQPDCILDLFNTKAQSFDRVYSTNPGPLTLNYIINKQKTLCNSFFKESTAARKGTIRDIYNAFSVDRDTATHAGIKSLLQRIQKDNTMEGFALGEFKKLNIVTLFCNEIVKQLELAKESKLNLKEDPEFFQKLKAQAIQSIMVTLKTHDIQISVEEVDNIVNHFLQDFVKLPNSGAENYLDVSKDIFHNLGIKHAYTSTKEELAFEMHYSRLNAVANAKTLAQLSDKELDEMASQLLVLMDKTGSLSVFPPKPELAVLWAEQALKEYESNINKLSSLHDILTSIATLVHELELLHLFYDANLRTCYDVMNEELLLHGIKECVLYNPNRLDLYSVPEFVIQMEQGICRFEYLRLEGFNILQELDRILDWQAKERCANPKNENSVKLTLASITKAYQNFTMALTDRIKEFNTNVNKKLGELLTLITNLEKLNEHSENKLFNSSENVPEFCAKVRGCIDKYQKTKNLREFFNAMDALEKNVPQTGKADFMRITAEFSQLTGYALLAKHSYQKPQHVLQ